MGKIETKELSFQELYNLQRTIQGEIEDKRADLEHIKDTLQARTTVEAFKDTYVEMKTNTMASSCSVTVRTKGQNLCKVYGVGSSTSLKGAIKRAHQITLIPRMLDLLNRVSDPRCYAFELREDAKNLIKEASAEDMRMEETGKAMSTYRSNGKSTVYTLVRKEDEQEH